MRTKFGRTYKDAAEFRKVLMSKGFRTIGEGSFGFAMSKGHEATKVWKIESGNDRKQAWARYIRAVANGELRGKHVPKVYLVVSLGCGGTAALVERLYSPFKDGKVSPVTQRQAWDTLQTLMSLSVPRGSKVPRSFRDFGLRLLTWIGPESSDLICDFNNGNVMWRRDGTAVVTDPVC
jgi:hypothetical protein